MPDGSTIRGPHVRGCLTFMAPTEEGETTVTISGLFVKSISEVIISAWAMPKGINLTEGQNFPVNGQLKKYPNVKFGLQEGASTTWMAIDRHMSCNRISTVSDPTRISLKVFGEEYSGCFDHVMKRIYFHVGAPHPEIFIRLIRSIDDSIEPAKVREFAAQYYAPSNRSRSLESSNPPWRRGELAQQDLTVLPTKGIGGYLYISTIVNCSTKDISVEACKSKTDAILHTTNFLSAHPDVSSIRVDHGGEFTSHDFEGLCARQGVGLEYSAPGAKGSVGTVERAHQTVKNRIERLMELIGFECRPELWPWFVKAAEYAINVGPESEAPYGLGFGDPVKFTTPIDSGGNELSAAGSRYGLFLSHDHSGACSVMSVQNERVVRFTIHPRHVRLLDEGKYAPILTNIKWALGTYPHQYAEAGLDPSGNLVIDSVDDKGTTKSRKRGGKKTRRVRSTLSDNSVIISTIMQGNSNDLMIPLTRPIRGTAWCRRIGSDDRQTYQQRLDQSNALLKVAMRDGHLINYTSIPPRRLRRALARSSVRRIHYQQRFMITDEAPLDDVKAGKFVDADVKEWNSIIKNDVLVKVDDFTGTAIRTRFRRTYKKVTGGSKPKSRFIVCAYDDPREVETSTRLPSQSSRNLAVVYGLSQGWSAATTDVETAFLLVPMESDVYVRLPKELPPNAQGYEPGGVYKLKKALYGMKESPRLFNEFLQKTLATIGWETQEPGIFVLREEGVIQAVLIAYVDDLLVLSADPTATLRDVANVIPCSDIVPVDTTPQRHVGLEISGAPGIFLKDINKYIHDLPEFDEKVAALGLPPRPTTPSKIQTLLDAVSLEETPPTPSADVLQLYQELMGTLCWIGTCHPAAASRHGMLATLTHKCDERAINAALGVIRELQKYELSPLCYSAVAQPELRLWVDAAVHHHDGRRGWMVQLVNSDAPLTSKDNIIAWKSTTDKIKHASSTAGEVYAIMKALEETLDVFDGIARLFPNVQARILSDSNSGILQILKGGHTLKDYKRSEYIRHMIEHSIIKCVIEHVPTTIQLADALTKIKHINEYNHTTVGN